MKRGWHTIQGYSVHVDSDGLIRHGTLGEGSWMVTAYVYRACRNGDGWDREPCITPSAFAAGVKRGTVRLF